MTSPRRPGGGIFASLRFHNYRIWFLSALVANTGTWMQRVAQDWLVLRVLTDDSASATGLTTALQFLPMLLLSAHAGLVADRVDQRKFLILTQSAMGLVSAVLAVDVLAGTAHLWHVYLAAFLTGVAAAYDAPARQTFVARMVPAEHLSNAVGLNSASFNAARLLGPALAGVVITWVGAGWVFAVNAATFVFPAVALVAMRVSELVDMPRARRAAWPTCAAVRTSSSSSRWSPSSPCSPSTSRSPWPRWCAPSSIWNPTPTAPSPRSSPSAPSPVPCGRPDVATPAPAP